MKTKAKTKTKNKTWQVLELTIKPPKTEDNINVYGMKLFESNYWRCFGTLLNIGLVTC